MTTAEQVVAGYDDAALIAAVDEARAAFEHTVRTDWPHAVEAYRAWRRAIAHHNAARSAFNDAHQRAYGRPGPWGTYPAHSDVPAFSAAVDRALRTLSDLEEDTDHD